MVNVPVKDIAVSILYDGQGHEIQTYTHEYISLMMLIYDKIYTEGFGECLGMGKCATCLVEIVSIAVNYPITNVMKPKRCYGQDKRIRRFVYPAKYWLKDISMG